LGRVSVVAVEFAEFRVVAVHQRAGRDVGRRETDRHVVLADRFILADRAARDLVTGRYLTAGREVFRWDFDTDRNIDPGDDDIVVRMQAYDRAEEALLRSFYHESRCLPDDCLIRKLSGNTGRGKNL